MHDQAKCSNLSSTGNEQIAQGENGKVEVLGRFGSGATDMQHIQGKGWNISTRNGIQGERILMHRSQG